MVTKDGKTYKLREDFNRGQVVVLVNETPVYRDGSYKGAASHLQNTYGLTDGELMTVYADYKEDYDM